MAESYKVLGQQAPTAAVSADLYTVPVSKEASVSTIMVCNRSTATTFRLFIAITGAAETVTQPIAYDAPLEDNESKPFTIGVTLSSTDKIRCQSASGSVTFSAFGVEITP